LIINQERIVSDNDATASILFIDGVLECFVIEDEYREHKVPKETRIPAGDYRIKVRTWGGFNARYTRKFPDFHQGMLELVNVPNFKDILIHIGNYESNTDGCLLVNAGVRVDPGNITGQSSTDAYRRFYKKVIDAAINDDLTIEIFDRDLQ